MIVGRVDAGTVLHVDFDKINKRKAQFKGAHPAIVVTPRGQQDADGTVIVVPLTSELSNIDNPAAIEIYHSRLNGRSPTRRTFAIINKPTVVDLKDCDYYVIGHSEGRNQVPRVEISGSDLSAVLHAYGQFVLTDSARKMLQPAGAFAAIAAWLKRRTDYQRSRRRATSGHAGEVRYEPTAAAPPQSPEPVQVQRPKIRFNTIRAVEPTAHTNAATPRSVLSASLRSIKGRQRLRVLGKRANAGKLQVLKDRDFVQHAASPVQNGDAPSTLRH